MTNKQIIGKVFPNFFDQNIRKHVCRRVFTLGEVERMLDIARNDEINKQKIKYRKFLFKTRF